MTLTTGGAGGGASGIGTSTDAAVTTDANGTAISFLRGLAKILGSVWDSVNNRLFVEINTLARTEDAIAATPATDAVMLASVELTPVFVPIAAATNGDNTLLAGITSKKIRVLKLFLLAGAAGNVYFTSAASGTVIFGGSTNKIDLAANGGFVLPGGDALGWFETAAGQALVMNASSTGPFSGGFVYVAV